MLEEVVASGVLQQLLHQLMTRTPERAVGEPLGQVLPQERGRSSQQQSNNDRQRLHIRPQVSARKNSWTSLSDWLTIVEAV